MKYELINKIINQILEYKSSPIINPEIEKERLTLIKELKTMKPCTVEMIYDTMIKSLLFLLNNKN